MPIFGNNILAGASGVVADTGIDVGTYTGKSLCFDDGTAQTLTRTPGGAGNRRTWTLSVWFKRSTLGTIQNIFSGKDGSYPERIRFEADDTLHYDHDISGTDYTIQSTQVFRDTSAWYHLVVAKDTTLSKEVDRIKFYINGEQITMTEVANGYPPEDYDGAINNTGDHAISGDYTGGECFDGYLAGFALVDGQQLDASAFGHYSADTGAWVMEDIPIADAQASGGTETTDGEYKVHKFTSSGSLTISQAGTIEYLVVGGGGSGGGSYAGGGGAGGVQTGFMHIPAGVYSITVGNGGAAADSGAANNGQNSVFHTITSTGGGGGGNTGSGDAGHNGGSGGGGAAGSGAGGTGIEGQGMAGGAGSSGNAGGGGGGASSVGAAGSSATGGNGGPGLSLDIVERGTNVVYGDGGGGGGQSGGGSGQTTGGNGDVTSGMHGTANTGSGGGGRWVGTNTSGAGGSGIVVVRFFNPTSLTFGTNGFYLEFKNTSTASASASTIGADTSGETNHWTSNNFTSVDSALPDTPVNNFATFNSLAFNSLTLSEGSLKATASSGGQETTGTMMPKTGKWYFELLLDNLASNVEQFGITRQSAVIGSTYLQGVNYRSDANKFVEGTSASYGASWTTNDIMGAAIDLDANTIIFYKNNSSQGSLSFTDGHDMTPMIRMGASGNIVIANFGQDSSFNGEKTAQNNADENGHGDFQYTPPSGYLALCSKNMPDVEIGQEVDDLANDHFNMITWTGNDSNPRNFTGFGFDPDMIWAKAREQSLSWSIYDTERGAGNDKELLLDDPMAEGASNQDTYGFLSAFITDGFTASAGSGTPHYYFNEASRPFIGFGWLAGEAIGTGDFTQGSVASTGQRNTDAGFSIIKWTNPASGEYTIGHGLSKAPDMMISKDREGSVSWTTYHSGIGATGILQIDGNYAVSTSSGYFSDTNPTATLMTLNQGGVGTANNDMIAYFFTSIEGYSKFGKYTGNNSSDGTFVYCGFKPAWVCVKRFDSTGSWEQVDNKRTHQTNPIDADLLLDTPDAEYEADRMDFVSNGFKLRTNSAAFNGSSGSYVFMAFAETPFKFATAR